MCQRIIPTRSQPLPALLGQKKKKRSSLLPAPAVQHKHSKEHRQEADPAKSSKCLLEKVFLKNGRDRENNISVSESEFIKRNGDTTRLIKHEALCVSQTRGKFRTIRAIFLPLKIS